MPPQKVIAIVGPTASGKSALGVLLAQKVKGEVISADSRQVYKGLDIATGKVTKKEMSGVPHHLLSVANPKKQFSADDFVQLGTKAIEKITVKNHVPIVVGGTGFYVDALLGRMQLANVPPNPALRKKLKSKTAEQLYKILLKKDPERAQSIDRKNPVRLIRAIEVAKGKPATRLVAEPVDVRGLVAGSSKIKPDVLWLGINPSKEMLHKNIHTRTLSRIKLGMIAEAKRLHAQGLSYKRMEELGLEYRFLSQYLQNKTTKEELVEAVERGNREYAKRQMRWFKRNKEIHWVKNKTEATKLTKEFLSSGR